MQDYDELVAPSRTIIVYQRDNVAADAEALREIKLLTTSAGAEVVCTLTSYRKRPLAATFIGTGKVEELHKLVKELGADLVVMNHSITPIQERNLERAVSCRVLGRTGLILDIFAQRAQTHEGKLQVELAQLKHLSTRLVRGWTHLERQKGGIGLRGPGETQLETDRRLIGQRIKSLNSRLKKVSVQRGLRRKSRAKVPVPTVSLVGYTNAGKSSLFNRLTEGEVYVEDQLFATLDTTMRRLELPGFGPAILSDTVGFIRDLPHTLVEAFHSTLEEVSAAQVLLHVVDASDEDKSGRMKDVDLVLREIGADTIPVITVYNKIDLANLPPHAMQNEAGMIDRVWISATNGEGIPDLLGAIAGHLRSRRTTYHVDLPVSAARLRARIYEKATVLGEVNGADGGWRMELELSDAVYGWLRKQPDVLTIHPMLSAPDGRSGDSFQEIVG